MDSRNFLLFLILILLHSCSGRMIYDAEYKGEKNYENFYLIDTIEIKDPVRIHSLKYGGQFIISKSILKDYSDRRDFFNRPDVFILGEDLYRDLPEKNHNRHHYIDEGGCKLIKANSAPVNLEIYEFKPDSVRFLLGLINSNYYYTKHKSFESFGFREKNKKSTFYKIVYPLCK